MEREACIVAYALQRNIRSVPASSAAAIEDKNLSAVSPASATAALMQGTEGHQRDPIAPWRQSLVLAEARVEDEILGYKNGRDSGEKVSSGWTVLPTDEMFVQRCLWVLERSHAIAAGAIGAYSEGSGGGSLQRDLNVSVSSPKPWSEGQGPGIIPGQEEYVAFESLGLTMPQPWLSHVGVSTAAAGRLIPGVTLRGVDAVNSSMRMQAGAFSKVTV